MLVPRFESIGVSGSVPLTPLRKSYRRARTLDADAALRECVDQLQHPELIAMELAESHSQVARYFREGGTAGPSRRCVPPDTPGETPRDAFYASRDISVIRDSSSFTCLEGAFEPLCESRNIHAGEDAEGLDYAGITCTAAARPVLGVVQASRDGSTYALLLRLLACLCEITHAAQIDRLDALCFGGMLGAHPNLDLHLVLGDDRLNDEQVIPERTPINQLTRDLAERAKAALLVYSQSPPMLGDILCLHMNPVRFQGRVRFDWRV